MRSISRSVAASCLTPFATIRVVTPVPDLKQAVVIASSHPSPVDALVGARVLPNTVSPMAWQFTRADRKPWRQLTMPILKHAGALMITGQQSATQQAIDHLNKGGSLWIAPAGRCHPGQYLQDGIRKTACVPTKTGTAVIASQAQVPVVPMAIRGSDACAELVTHKIKGVAGLAATAAMAGAATMASSALCSAACVAAGVGLLRVSAPYIAKLGQKVTIDVAFGKPLYLKPYAPHATFAQKEALLREHQQTVAEAVNNVMDDIEDTQ